MQINRILSAGWSAVYDGSNEQTLEISGIENVALYFREPLVEAGLDLP